MQCSGITQKNQRCRRKITSNGSFCHIHTERGEIFNEVEIQRCPICFTTPQKPKKFDCHHMLCHECYARVKKCPLCRYPKFSHPAKNITLESYRGMFRDPMIVMLRDYVAGFITRQELTNYTAQLLSGRFRTYDYLRGLYIILSSDLNDEKITDKIIQIIIIQ